jgi:hypothetical protein
MLLASFGLRDKSQAKKQHEAGSKHSTFCLLQGAFLFGLLIDTEDKANLFLCLIN